MITVEQAKSPILKDIITRKTAVSGRVYTDIGGATYIGNDEGGLSVIQIIGGEVTGDLKNSQINKIGSFNREQILAGLALVPDASKTAKGISKLSTTPEVKTNPIAVGDNDPRNSDARVPTAHASTHQSGGSDPINFPVNFITAIAPTSSVSLAVAGGSLSATVLPAGVDHNLLLNYVADKHIAHSGVSIVAGTGLSGGGDITATRTLTVVPSAIDHNSLANLTTGDFHTQYLLKSGSIADITTRTHGLLTSLSADDHVQYALLAGRAGGQTIIGGTGASENLTLQSTSHATKGKILFGTSAYDEVNNRLGINTATPLVKFEVLTTLGQNNDLRLRATNGSWVGFNMAAANVFDINSNVGKLFQFTQTSMTISAWLSAGTTISATVASAGAGNSNRDGMDFLVYAGQSTGNRPGGKLRLGVTLAGASGTQGNPVKESLTIDADDGGNLLLADEINFVFNATTGTKIGTATTQKLSLWNATPIVQPTGIIDADGTLADITTKFNSLIGKLESMGALAVA